MGTRWLIVQNADEIKTPEVREVVRALLALPQGIADQRVLRVDTTWHRPSGEAVVFLATRRAAILVDERVVWGTCSPLRPEGDDRNASAWWSIDDLCTHTDEHGVKRLLDGGPLPAWASLPREMLLRNR